MSESPTHTTQPQAVRVLVAQGSPVARALLSRALSAAGMVVQAVASGSGVVAAIGEFNPHVVCLPPHLPDTPIDALAARIMAESPRPVLGLFPALEEADGPRLFKLLEAGAADLFPYLWGGLSAEDLGRAVGRAVRAMAHPDRSGVLARKGEDPLRLPGNKPLEMVVIGAGMGGFSAMRELLSTLPAELAVPVLCVQAVGPELFQPYMEWLFSHSRIPVRAAHQGEFPMPGGVYFAPPGRHLILGADRRFVLSDFSPSDNNAPRPSITVTMESVVAQYGAGCMGVLLSGGGDDGGKGLRAVYSSGGHTVVQSPASCLDPSLLGQAITAGTASACAETAVIGKAIASLAALNKPEVAVEEPPPGNGKHLLIVEDSPIQAAMLKRILIRGGYQVTVAADGVAGLESCRATRPDLIVSDISMPRMDGFEMCSRVKADEALQKIPVILLTALSDPSEILQGLEAGAENYITKPYDEHYLLDRIAHLLEHPAPSPKEAAEALAITFEGRRYVITSSRRQILHLLLSTYQNAVHQNRALVSAQTELKLFNEKLVEHAHRQQQLNEQLGREVDERTRLQERQDRLLADLETSNRELKEFAYVVSHDLKAPLRAIGSLVQWLAEDYADVLEGDGQEQLALLRGRVDRMHNLIEGILQYSRVGRLREDPVEVELPVLLPQIADALAPPPGITIAIQPDLPTVRGERVRIEQLFQNLLSNAIKYMDKEEGHIGVSGVREDNGWRFSVSDDGPGIEERYFDKIFQIFQTLRPRDEFESTGIGLTLVKKIVELHGGRVWVESQVGKGSTFHFTLPDQPPS